MNYKDAIERWGHCTVNYADGRPCGAWAGRNTDHEGYGPCSNHEKRYHRELWKMAFDIANELDISPWDALLLSVRRAAGRVKWVDDQLQEATRRNDGDPTAKEVRFWLKESRNERRMLAQVSKAAVDSGIADRLVRQIELEGRIVADAIATALDSLDLTPEQRMKALTRAHEHLLEAGDSQTIIVDGTTLHDDDDDDPKRNEK